MAPVKIAERMMDCRGLNYVVIERSMIATGLYRVQREIIYMEYVQEWSADEQPETPKAT